jgi:RNA polymerase sigma-70 factor (ECF subfamily)
VANFASEVGLLLAQAFECSRGIDSINWDIRKKNRNIVSTEVNNSDEVIVQMISRCQRELRTFVAGVTSNGVDADDILQEVNLALWKKRHLYNPQQQTDFLRWALGFAVMEVRRFRSRLAKSRLSFGDEVLDSLVDDWPSDSSVNNQRRDALSNCLKQLPPTQRVLITEFYSKRSSAQQLATKHDKPLSTIYKIITRIRELLRECVKRSISQMQHPL